MTSKATLEELRRWVDDRRASAEREREEVRASGAFVEDPIGAAIDLIAIAGEMYGWPLPEDPVTQRENEIAWESWARLRRALGGP